MNTRLPQAFGILSMAILFTEFGCKARQTNSLEALNSLVVATAEETKKYPTPPTSLPEDQWTFRVRPDEGTADAPVRTYGLINPGQMQGANLTTEPPVVGMSLGQSTYNPVPKVLPPRFDLRDYGTLATPRDQGSCPSCWAFATTQTMSDDFKLFRNESYELAPKYALDCAEHGVYNCAAGGYLNSAAELFSGYNNQGRRISSAGIVVESNYPYSPTKSFCNPGLIKKSDTSAFVGVGWNFVDWQHKWDAMVDTDLIKNAIMDFGPVTTTLATDWIADPKNPPPGTFAGYASGVFNNCMGGLIPGQTNHAVNIIGWQDDATIPSGGYWIIRNSFGSAWGENGYMRIVYKCNNIGTYSIYHNIYKTQNPITGIIEPKEPPAVIVPPSPPPYDVTIASTRDATTPADQLVIRASYRSTVGSPTSLVAFVNGIKVGSGYFMPVANQIYSFSYKAPVGFTGVANISVQALGGFSSTSVLAENSAVETISGPPVPPFTISIVSTRDAKTPSGALAITANISSVTPVSRIAATIDGASVGSVISFPVAGQPIKFNWSAPAGMDKDVAIVVSASNSGGQTAQARAIAHVTGIDNIPPTCDVITPRTSTVISKGTKSLPINVRATDNIAVSSIDVVINGKVTAKIKSMVYNWNVGLLKPGIYQIKCVAHDATGNTGASPIIKVKK